VHLRHTYTRSMASNRPAQPGVPSRGRL